MTETSFEARWLGMEGIFGGFVLGRIVDFADQIEGFKPQAVTIHFVSAVHPGDVQMTSEIVHQGRATASVRVELRQRDRVRVHAVASLVQAAQELTWNRAVDTSGWGTPEETPVYVPSHKKMSYGEHLDIRRVGEGTLEGGTACWVRMLTPPASHGLVGPHGVASVFLDALPPGLFSLEKHPVFVPTIDFTVHFAPDLGDIEHQWHYVTNHTVWTSRHFCVDESTLYDRGGRVLAQVRQGRHIRWS